MQQGRDAEDEVMADLGGGGLDHALAVFQTAVALKSVPGIAGAAEVTTARFREDIQVLTMGHENNLEERGRGGFSWQAGSLRI